MTTATLPSRTSSQQYAVCLNDDGSATCTCKAGQYGRSCWHVKALRAEADRAASQRQRDELNAKLDRIGARLDQLARESYEVVSLKTGRQYGAYASLEEATAARDEIGRRGGWAGVYQLP